MAVAGNDNSAISKDLVQAVGLHGLVDAAAIVANFVSITKIVDATGHRATKINVAAKVTGALVFLRAHVKQVIALLALIMAWIILWR